MSIKLFAQKKQSGEKITVITCYDYTSACITAETDVDAILIGDSVAMTMHGEQDTVAATTDIIALHVLAVKKGAPNKFIIADLPFLSYRQGLSEAVRAVQVLMQAGANAVKLEGVAGNEGLIRHLVDSGVPVMGHIGLTPQFVNAFGGYTVQGKTQQAEERLLTEAISLQAAGCFSLVIECVPTAVAKKITHAVTIPTVGIGAGNVTSGQVLVWQDFLGLNQSFKPKFVKQYVDGYNIFKSAINTYCAEVKNEEFPQDEHSYATE